jgi:hypothetical protein
VAGGASAAGGTVPNTASAAAAGTASNVAAVATGLAGAAANL